MSYLTKQDYARSATAFLSDHGMDASPLLWFKEMGFASNEKADSTDGWLRAIEGEPVALEVFERTIGARKQFWQDLEDSEMAGPSMSATDPASGSLKRPRGAKASTALTRPTVKVVAQACPFRIQYEKLYNMKLFLMQALLDDGEIDQDRELDAFLRIVDFLRSEYSTQSRQSEADFVGFWCRLLKTLWTESP
ncbi:hypothetical protein BGZ94_005225, partial [Podila epigama]